VTPTKQHGVNRVVWNLRHTDVAAGGAPVAVDDDGAPIGGRMAGPYVAPGTYTVRLRVDGQTFDKPVVVREDPRIDITPVDRKAWSDALTSAGNLYKRALAINVALAKAPAGPTLAENKRLAKDLVAHLNQLCNDLDKWVGKPTGDQVSRLAHYKGVVEKLEK